MRIGHTELFVRDPLASRDFYERVLGFEVTAVQHGGKVVWLAAPCAKAQRRGPPSPRGAKRRRASRMGDREILLRAGAPPAASPDYRHCGQAFVLFCDDLPATVRALEARGLVFRGDDGPSCPTFTDPDGHWFQLVDPREFSADAPA